MTRVLLVEDDRSIAHVITTALEDEGWKVDSCASIAERNTLLLRTDYHLMLTDVMLSDGDGIEGLEKLRQLYGRMPIIILSAQNTLDTAVRASETGAFEYFPKPFDLEDLVSASLQAVRSNQNKIENNPSNAPDMQQLPLVGRSAAMQDVYRMITRVLRNDLSVLILGESGTGKELVADAIHHLGHRKQGPFVAVNMAAIPSELIESELFGHEKGSFTGAVDQHIGRFEQAKGGTLFLDEIGDMPMQAQTRLLRALQSGRISRVGGKREIPLDVRIVCATNRNVPHLIEEGQFREDLYYRINVVPVHLPPLRERRDDIRDLVAHFTALAEKEGLPRRSYEESALRLLQQQYWRGNVRELQNLVYRVAVFSRDERITAALLAPLVSDAREGEGTEQLKEFSDAITHFIEREQPVDGQLYLKSLKAFEVPLLKITLGLCDGNQLKAASMLGINRNTLRKKLINYDIDIRDLR